MSDQTEPWDAALLDAEERLGKAQSDAREHLRKVARTAELTYFVFAEFVIDAFSYAGEHVIFPEPGSVGVPEGPMVIGFERAVDGVQVTQPTKRLGITTEAEVTSELTRYSKRGSEADRVLTALRNGRVVVPNESEIVMVTRGGVVSYLGVHESSEDYDYSPENLLDVLYEPSWGFSIDNVLEVLIGTEGLFAEIMVGTTHAALAGAPVEWSRAFLYGKTIPSD